MNSCEVSTERKRLDYSLICQELKNSYWAKDRTSEQIINSIENSICFGIYHDSRQLGFARIITDQSTFAYLCDVFIIETERGKGLGQILMRSILEHDSFRTVSWTLRTKDAHRLYEKFGFVRTHRPENYMERAAL